MTETPGDAALKALLKSGTRLSRLTALDVVCTHQRRLVRVFPLNGEMRTLYSSVAEGVIESTGLHGVTRQYDWDLGYLDGNDADAWVTMSTSCCAKQITLEWLREMVDSGKRRVVAP